MMTIHREFQAFQALSGQPVHFITSENRGEFSSYARWSMADALKAGVIVVGTNAHKRYCFSARIPLERIDRARREWGPGMSHGVRPSADIGVRFFKAYDNNMIEAGGKNFSPTAVVLIEPGRIFDGAIPDHGECPVRHYTYNPNLGELSLLAYVGEDIGDFAADPVLRSCRASMRGMTSIESGEVTREERIALRRSAKGVRLYSTDGVVIVQGLTPDERSSVVAHANECRELLQSFTSHGSLNWSRFARHHTSSVVGFSPGGNTLRRFSFEHHPERLEFWELQQNRQSIRYADAGGR